LSLRRHSWHLVLQTAMGSLMSAICTEHSNSDS
jgi:hypothetical protein